MPDVFSGLQARLVRATVSLPAAMLGSVFKGGINWCGQALGSVRLAARRARWKGLVLALSRPEATTGRPNGGRHWAHEARNRVRIGRPILSTLGRAARNNGVSRNGGRIWWLQWAKTARSGPPIPSTLARAPKRGDRTDHGGRDCSNRRARVACTGPPIPSTLVPTAPARW